MNTDLDPIHLGDQRESIQCEVEAAQVLLRLAYLDSRGPALDGMGVSATKLLLEDIRHDSGSEELNCWLVVHGLSPKKVRALFPN